MKFQIVFFFYLRSHFLTRSHEPTPVHNAHDAGNDGDGQPEGIYEVHQSGRSGSEWQGQQLPPQQVVRLAGRQAGCGGSDRSEIKTFCYRKL